MTMVTSFDGERESSDIVMKRCQTCRQYQALDEFYRNNRHTDGLMHTCKACQAVKACTTCHHVKPLDAFYAQGTTPDGRQRRCKTCAQQRQKAFRAAHPEHVQEQDARFRHAYADKIPARRARWRQAHPGKSQEYEATRRARKRRAGKIEPIDRDYIYKRDQGICSLCGRKVRKQDMSIDHIVPLSLGGAHCLTNVTLVHLQCNTRKRTRAVPQQMYLIG